MCDQDPPDCSTTARTARLSAYAEAESAYLPRLRAAEATTFTCLEDLEAVHNTLLATSETTDRVLDALGNQPVDVSTGAAAHPSKFSAACDQLASARARIQARAEAAQTATTGEEVKGE